MSDRTHLHKHYLTFTQQLIKCNLFNVIKDEEWVIKWSRQTWNKLTDGQTYKHWHFLSFCQSQKYYNEHCNTDFRDLVKIGESDCNETVDVGLSHVSDWVTDACYDIADTSVFDTWEFQVSFKLSSFILTFMWTSKKSSWKHQKHFFFMTCLSDPWEIDFYDAAIKQILACVQVGSGWLDWNLIFISPKCVPSMIFYICHSSFLISFSAS